MRGNQSQQRGEAPMDSDEEEESEEEEAGKKRKAFFVPKGGIAAVAERASAKYLTKEQNEAWYDFAERYVIVLGWSLFFY